MNKSKRRREYLHRYFGDLRIRVYWGPAEEIRKGTKGSLGGLQWEMNSTLRRTAPFEREDSQHFFGREREASELLSRVVAHPALLLYSQSGAGKTSLLKRQPYSDA
jgi:hypothetical protein